MVRLSSLPANLARRYAEAKCPKFETPPVVAGPPICRRRIAIISSAGLMRRGQQPFVGGDKDYRVLPHATPASEIMMSHVSLGFDRTAFQQDLNSIFPVDRLDELAACGTIGSVAATHFSFMGGSSPDGMEPYAREVADALRSDEVTAALLLPV